MKLSEIYSLALLISKLVINFNNFRSNFVIIFIDFRYIPSISANVAPESPGIILAIPIIMPLRILEKNNFNFCHFLVSSLNMRCNLQLDLRHC